MISFQTELKTADGPLPLRISASREGAQLPTVLWSHGHGYSRDDYTPLVRYWAANGFAVIQPTHEDSVSLDARYIEAPRPHDIWRRRIDDLGRTLDRLEAIAASHPELAGRLDPTRVIVAGHSFGAHTAQALIGAKILAADRTSWLDFSDPRVMGAVLMGPPGDGAGLSAEWADRIYLNVDWSMMDKPALIVAGDLDAPWPMSDRGWDWRTDPYCHAPVGAKHLLTLRGAGHFLGGILGEPKPPEGTVDATLDAVCVASTAFMQSVIDPQAPAWALAAPRLTAASDPIVRLESK